MNCHVCVIHVLGIRATSKCLIFCLLNTFKKCASRNGCGHSSETRNLRVFQSLPLPLALFGLVSHHCPHLFSWPYRNKHTGSEGSRVSQCLRGRLSQWKGSLMVGRKGGYDTWFRGCWVQEKLNDLLLPSYWLCTPHTQPSPLPPCLHQEFLQVDFSRTPYLPSCDLLFVVSISTDGFWHNCLPILGWRSKTSMCDAIWMIPSFGLGLCCT